MLAAQALASSALQPHSFEPVATLPWPYFGFPNHLIDLFAEAGLSSNAVRLYLVQYRHSWGFRRRYCRLSNARLQELTRSSLNTLRSAVRELTGAGLIRQGSTNAQGTLYLVFVPPAPKKPTQCPEQLRDHAEALALSQAHTVPQPPVPAPASSAPEELLEEVVPKPPVPATDQAEALALNQVPELGQVSPQEPYAPEEVLEEVAPNPLVPTTGPASGPLIPLGSAADPRGDQILIPPYDLKKQGKDTTHTARVDAPQAGELPWSSLTPSIIAGLCQAFSALAVVRAILTVWFAYRKQPGEVRRPAALLRECLSGRGGWQLLSDTEIGDWLYSAARTLQRRTRIDSTGVWTDPLRAEVDALVDWLAEHRGGSLDSLFQAYTALCPTLAGPERCSLYWLLSTCGGA